MVFKQRHHVNRRVFELRRHHRSVRKDLAPQQLSDEVENRQHIQVIQVKKETLAPTVHCPAIKIVSKQFQAKMN